MVPSFSLTLSLPLLAERRDEYVQDLARLMPGVGMSASADATHLTVAFELGAERAETLLQRAVDALRQASPQAVLLHAAPDLLPLPAIAALVGLPRSSLDKLRESYPESFPRESFEAAGVWHLTHVLRWIRAVGAIHIDATLFEVASACEQLNARILVQRPWRAA
jgi:hypothetical protein